MTAGLDVDQWSWQELGLGVCQLGVSHVKLCTSLSPVGIRSETEFRPAMETMDTSLLDCNSHCHQCERQDLVWARLVKSTVPISTCACAGSVGRFS